MIKTFDIIGNMTGNSMDAIDLVLTRFHGDEMHDICSYSVPYCAKFQKQMEKLRQMVVNKTADEISKIPLFHTIHDQYIQTLAIAINKMCDQYNINKNNIDAIGFHGKTLDHNPPSIAKKNKSLPYTLQMGSGQMLANMTHIPVVYDFRSDFIMNGCEGAPLIPTHNAHISSTEGDAIYYNGGNTANFAVIKNKRVLIASDAGPFNEYIDKFIRNNTDQSFDCDGMFGKSGKTNHELLNQLFNICHEFYQMPLPKSGDPQYYNANGIFEIIQKQKIPFNDAIHTMEYFSAYIAAYSMNLIPINMEIPNNIFLFGGGWKNPVVYDSFKKILYSQHATILPEHRATMLNLRQRFKHKPNIRFSKFADNMEPRLCADMAKYRLENKVWDTYDSLDKNIISGIIAYPNNSIQIRDKINRAAKGWQR